MSKHREENVVFLRESAADLLEVLQSTVRITEAKRELEQPSVDLRLFASRIALVLAEHKDLADAQFGRLPPSLDEWDYRQLLWMADQIMDGVFSDTRDDDAAREERAAASLLAIYLYQAANYPIVNRTEWFLLHGLVSKSNIDIDDRLLTAEVPKLHDND